MENNCPITRNMPIGAFVVFSGSLLVFTYLYIMENNDKNERPNIENIWIGLFFLLLISCMCVSGVCMLRSNTSIKNTKMGKKVNKKINTLKDKFGDSLPNFIGKKIF